MGTLSIFRKGGIQDERRKPEKVSNSTIPLSAPAPISTAVPALNPAQTVPQYANYPEFSTISTEFSTEKSSNQQLTTALSDIYQNMSANTQPAAYDPPDKLYLRIGDSLPLGVDAGNNTARDIIGRIRNIDIERIVPNPSQPRKNFDDEAIIRLADSIRRYGILQPVSVRTGSAPDSPFVLIAGERRLRAARLLGLKDVPCVIVEADERMSAELAIIENLQREDLNVFEQASAIASLIDIFSLTQEQIASRLSVSQSYIANKLRILRLTERERVMILEGGLTERHARALLKIEDVDRRIEVIRHIIARSLNVAAAEDYIERMLCAPIMSPDAIKSRRKLVLKDIRIFYNTIEKALSTVKAAGISVVSNRTESDDCIELVIKIPKGKTA